MSSPTTRSRRLGDGTATSSRNSWVTDASRVRGTRRVRYVVTGAAPSSPASESEVITSENIG